MTSSIQIRAVVFKEAGIWCAQCIEHDIAVQADSEDKLIKDLVAMLKAYVQLSIEDDAEPFAGIPKAPAKFEQMFDRARTKSEFNKIPAISKDEAPTIVPTLRMLEPQHA